MTVVSGKTLAEFVRKHPDAGPALERWLLAARRAEWRNLVEVRGDFPHADAVGPLTVFNVRGNRYRLIVRIDYRWQVISIKGVLTHEEYSRERWKE